MRVLHRRAVAQRRHHPALRRSARPQATAHATGTVLTMVRTADVEMVAVLCDFSDDPAAAAITLARAAFCAYRSEAEEPPAGAGGGGR